MVYCDRNNNNSFGDTGEVDGDVDVDDMCLDYFMVSKLNVLNFGNSKNLLLCKTNIICHS